MKQSVLLVSSTNQKTIGELCGDDVSHFVNRVCDRMTFSKRNMEWQWRVDHMTADRKDYEFIKSQLETESELPRYVSAL